MPRSFLLRRSVRSDEKGNNRKIRHKGHKSEFYTLREGKQGELKESYGGQTGNFHFSQDLNAIDTLGSYTYQSYIDGNTLEQYTGLIKADFFASPKDQIDEPDIQLEPTKEKQKVNSIPTKEMVQVPEGKPVYRCEQCGKTFKTKYTLTIHLKMPNHTGARPFVCNICGKGFRLSSTLCRHKIIHTSDKPHKCHICQKAFNRSSTLKTHIRTHSEQKEFVCEICGKGFHQKGNLRNHFLIHTGEKPYNCRLCNKAFNKLSNLKFHLHVHTDNTPYRCRFCKKAFSRRCDLKHHIHKTHDRQHKLSDSEDI